MGKRANGWILAAGFVFVGAAAQATTRVKANNADNLNLSSSWLVAAPGAADLAQWNNTVMAANTVLLGANLSFQGISIVSPGGAVTIGGSNTLTLGCQGLNMSSATVNLSLTNAALALASYANPVWTVASGRTLTVSPAVFNRSTAAVLSVQGAGSVLTATITNGTTGIIGPWATYGAGASMKYAHVSGGGILGHAAVTVAAEGVTDSSGMTNYDVTAVGTLGLGASFNTLRYNGGQGTVTGAFQANGLLNAGTGALTFGGGATIGSDRELVLLSPDSTRTLKLSGTISDNAGGTSGITVAGGDGRVSLTASNAYSGVTSLNSGILSINNKDALGTTNGNTVIFYSGRTTDGGRLALSGGVTLTEPITIVGGEIDSGGFAIYVAASGETNTLAGPITISTFNHTRIGAGSGSVLNIKAPITSAGNSVVLGPNGGMICVNAPIGIPGNLFLHGGPGSVVLNTNGNSFGTAYVQQGNLLRIGVPDAIATNKAIVVGSQYSSNTDNASTSSGRLDLGGVSQTISSLLGYLNGSGAATPNSRVITNSVAAPGTLTVGSANGNSAYYGIITDGAGTVSLGKIGTGTLLLTGTNTFSGTTTVCGGALVISNTFALQNSTLICTNSGTLRFSGGLSDFIVGGLAGTSNIGLTNANGTAVALTAGGNNRNTVYSGALSAGGSLVKVGTGSLTLAGPNTFSGTTSLTNGVLAFGCDSALGTAARLVISGGTLSAGTGNNALGRLVVAGAAAIDLGDGSCRLAFADCSEAWTGTLNITGGLGTTSLRFGTNASGLSQAQLDLIRIGGKKVWVRLDSQGYLRHVVGTLMRLF